MDDLMGDEDLPLQMRPVLERAILEASRRGAGTVEAEHLLLALAGGTRSVGAKTLAAAGLDYAALENALREERRASLASAGITTIDIDQYESTPRRMRPNWGASVRDMMRFAHRHVPKGARRRMTESDLILAILRADFGTVPRALAVAGIDRSALVASLEKPN